MCEGGIEDCDTPGGDTGSKVCKALTDRSTQAKTEECDCGWGGFRSREPSQAVQALTHFREIRSRVANETGRNAKERVETGGKGGLALVKPDWGCGYRRTR